MTGKLLLSGVVVVLALGLMAGPSSASEEAEARAVEAAEAWLAIVDQGDYEKSWEEAAELLRNAVTKGQFGQSLGAARGPLGEVQSRKVNSTQYATELPGAPDGEYVVIQFETSFAKKQNAVETVTPMLEADGAWRVSGYYIR